MLKKFRELLRASSEELSASHAATDIGNETHVTLRSLEVARGFPTVIAPDAPSGLELAAGYTCKRCDRPCDHVVITTWGPAGLAETWDTHPVALDGFSCPGYLSFPAQLTTAGADDLNRQAIQFAQAGEFDHAEFLFRRLMNSFPSEAAFRVNVGSIYLEKRRAAQAQGRPAELIWRYGERTRELFLSALECRGTVEPRVYLALARIYNSYGKAAEALSYLRQALQDPASSAQVLAEARALEHHLQANLNAGG